MDQSPPARHPPQTLPEADPPRPPLRTSPGASPGGEDDASLIRRSLSEAEAFAGVFCRHAGEIHRYAARRLGEASAEDVVSEVFLVAFRRRNSYDLSYGDARPWLYGIATNVISRHRHAEARNYRTLARTGLDPALASPADDVVARVAATSQRRAIAAALARLRASDRDTLLLNVWGDLTYEQTARALSIPVGTVRSRLSRARGLLRAALGQADPSAPADSAASAPADSGPAEGRSRS